MSNCLNVSRKLEDFLSLYQQVFEYWRSHGYDDMTQLCFKYGDELMDNPPKLIKDAVAYRGSWFSSRLEIASVGYAYALCEEVVA